MKYCLLIVFSLLTVISCKKVEVPQSKQEKMRASDWRVDTIMITYLTSTGADSEVQGGWKRIENGVETYDKPNCIKDDYIKFKQNFSGSHITGPDKCLSNEANEIDFTWGLTEADTKIYVYGLYNLFTQDVNADMLYFQDDEFAFTFHKKIPKNATDSITVKATYKLKKK